ncbi:unnamed protein product [Ectocarpus sp. 13 AM-2016]
MPTHEMPSLLPWFEEVVKNADVVQQREAHAMCVHGRGNRQGLQDSKRYTLLLHSFRHSHPRVLLEHDSWQQSTTRPIVTAKLFATTAWLNRHTKHSNATNKLTVKSRIDSNTTNSGLQ